jgi:hypothetical protein
MPVTDPSDASQPADELAAELQILMIVLGSFHQFQCGRKPIQYLYSACCISQHLKPTPPTHSNPITYGSDEDFHTSR